MHATEPATQAFSEEDVETMLREMRGMPQAFVELFARESEQALHLRADDGWSAVEVVGRLAGHDAFERTRRFEAISTSDTPSLPDDHTRLNVAKANYQALSVVEALSWFERQRTLLMALLERIGPRDWMRTGIHPRDGERTLFHVADLRGHDREHFEQARTAIDSTHG